MIRLGMALLLLGATSPALACINDEESPRHEREFRSQYLQALASSIAGEDGMPGVWPWYLGGGVMLAGAFAAARSRGRSEG